MEAVNWINDTVAEAREQVRELLKRRWAGEEVDIDPTLLGKQIQHTLQMRLVNRLTEENEDTVKRTLEVLHISHDEAKQLLIDSFRRPTKEGRKQTERLADDATRYKPTFLRIRKALEDVYR